MPDFFWSRFSRSPDSNKTDDLESVEKKLRKDSKAIHKEIKSHRHKGNASLEANCFEKLAFLYFESGLYDDSITFWTEALRIYQDIKDRKCMAESFSNLATAYRLKKDFQNATRHYKRALLLDQEFNKPEDELSSLHNLGGTWFDMGDCENALENFSIAQDVAKRENLKEWESISLYRIGLCYQSRFQYQTAFPYLEEGLKISASQQHLEMMTLCTYGLGECYEFLGEYSQSIACYEDSITGAINLRDDNLHAMILISLAELMIHLGFMDKARDIARKIEEEIAIKPGGLATLYLGLLKADIYSLQGVREKASSVLDEIEKVALGFVNPVYQAFVLIKKIGCETAGSRFKNALDLLDKLQGIYPEGKSHSIDLERFLILGKLYRGINGDDKALSARESAVQKAEILNLPRYQWIANHALGRLYQNQHRFDVARDAYQKALKWIDLAAKSLEPGLRQVFIDHKERLQVYQDYITLQLSTGHKEIAQRTLKRVNSEALNKKLGKFFE